MVSGGADSTVRAFVSYSLRPRFEA